jgi:hypothetical protein
MKGKRFTEALRSLTKSMQQAQHRVLAEFKLSRWPTPEEFSATLGAAAQLEWKMERIQYWAERHFIVMNAEAF